MIGNVNTTFELLCDNPWLIMISYNSVNDKKKKEAGTLILISIAFFKNNATQNNFWISVLGWSKKTKIFFFPTLISFICLGITDKDNN